MCSKADGKSRGRTKLLKGERHVLMPADPLFPQQLLNIPHAPDRLYVVGNPEAISEGIAIIGARKATPYGVSCASNFARIAASKGVCVISGGAYGCDSAAHRAAIAANGATVVFLGSGCDCVYPRSNFAMFQGIIDGGGAVVSEYPWEEPPRRPYFLARNRLIAGAAKAVLIVEAGLPSGTFSTAEEALKANKDVLVVPGAISSACSHGSNTLLFQGAIPVIDDETFEEVLFWLFGSLKQERAAAADGEESGHPLLDALRAQPMRLEEILSADIAGIDASASGQRQLSAKLLELETEGKIARYPNGKYGPVVQGGGCVCSM